MPKPPDPRFAAVTGANLLAARRKAGLSQKELGERASLHRKTIGHLESGEQAMMTDTLFKLGAGLGIHPAALLDGLPSWNTTEQRFGFEPRRLLKDG
jgi:transcriptional regulator with XRE-family HTH domain